MTVKLILILIAALILRLINLRQSLWLDEAISVTAVQQFSLNEILSKFITYDVHPPLYYLLLKVWGNFFGYSEVSMRMPSVLFGVGIVILSYLIAKKLFSVQTALIAAVFVTVNPLLIYYSQEARMYSQAAFFTALAVFGFVEKRWIIYVLGIVLAVYTDYLPLLLIPALFFIRTDRRKFFIATFTVLIFCLPWLPNFLIQFRTGSQFATVSPEWGSVVGGASFKNFLLVWVKFIFGRITLDNKYLYAVITVIVTGFYLFLAGRSKKVVLWWWLLLPIFLVFIISFKVPIFAYHRFLFVLPAFLLLVADGAKRKSWVLAVLSISLLSLIYFSANTRFQRENWRDAVVYIKNDEGEVLMPNLSQSAAIKYYAPDLAIFDLASPPKSLTPTVYLLRYVQDLFDRQDILRKNLENAGYQKIEEKIFNGVLVWKYHQID